ncbi:hypothetical protein [Candidatus Contendibacter odensensis]|uniref:Uncharacterized protein n=1 Tax=Candidatus Contendobacter odensis Run_B_J11 TaxID=1400861 RepID=A0A7U7J2M0_9GAMM|nr:hypothetical protein [Candidatus Contendobacter odensis]MBK8751214.1 hypothetical protein [Candidatus Competibacteraceae bacterium]CDH44292.1 hypothetical protein BN874_160048 [Candidatus Contendobacter odensis Run_B_J11]
MRFGSVERKFRAAAAIHPDTAPVASAAANRNLAAAVSVSYPQGDFRSPLTFSNRCTNHDILCHE